MDMKGLSRVTDMFYILIGVVVTWCTYLQNLIKLYTQNLHILFYVNYAPPKVVLKKMKTEVITIRIVTTYQCSTGCLYMLPLNP